MQDILNQLSRAVQITVPSIIGALVILIVGYVVALIAAAVARGAVRRLGLGPRIGRWMAGPDSAGAVDAAPAVGRAVFWIVMVFVLLGFFQALSLTLITRPLDQFLTLIFSYLPLLVGAGMLLLVAWIVATVLRTLLLRLLPTLRLDERLGASAGTRQEGRPLTRSIAEAVYWLVFLLFLPAILGALGLTGLLGPVQHLVDEMLGFLPKLLAAALLLLVGWFVARLVQRIVTNLLAAIGIDRVGERVGLTTALGGQRLSGVIGLVVYILILLPIVISALQALQLGAVTAPASTMLTLILAEIPKLFAAGLTLAIAYVLGRVLAGLVAQLLAGIGFDGVPARLGLPGAVGAQPAPSTLVGRLVLIAIMLFAVIEACQVVGFSLVATLAYEFTRLAGHVLLGLCIIALGLWLARLAAGTVRASGAANAGMLAGLAQAAIVVLAGAMGLREMGIAPEIITLAFGLLLGAIAVASAIAFGVGGRQVAGRELERWVERRRLGGPTETALGRPDQPATGR